MPVEGPLARFIDEDADLDNGAQPDTVPRKFHDIPCCLFFLLLLCGVGFLQHAADYEGNLLRFEGFTDYNGKFCGVSNSVVNKPYLYFCEDNLQPDHKRRNRMCVETCAVGHKGCPDGGKVVPYATETYAGILCMPKNPRQRHTVGEFLSDPDIGIFLFGIALTRAWPVIFLSMVTSILLAFFYLCVISRCKKSLVSGGLLLTVLMCLALGIYLMSVAAKGGADHMLFTGDASVSFIIGAVIVVIGFGVLLVALLYGKSLSASIACIKAGGECIWDSPSIVFEPFLHLAMTLCLMILMCVGFLRLISWLDQDRTVYAGDVSIRVRLSYSWFNIVCILFYGCMCAWLMELNNAISYFATSYAAQLWFFAPYDRALNSKEAPAFATCKGYAVAFRYSLGSLIYGSGSVCFFRVPRAFFGSLFYSGAGGTGNPMVSALSAPCTCCKNWYEGFLRYMSPGSYMDIALNGARFCKAAYFTTTVMNSEVVSFFSQHGASWLVQFIGHFFVSAVGGMMTYFMCSSETFLGEIGVESAHSEYYIPRPSLMGFFAAAMCWICSHPFLTLPGHIADTLLFCFSVERRRLSRSTVARVVEQASLFSRLTTCTSREQQHVAGSVVAQPPLTQRLLEEAQHDNGWFD